jgi:hypothetical protein
MALNNARHQVVEDDLERDEPLPSFSSDEGEEYAPTKVGTMSRAHIEEMMQTAENSDANRRESDNIQESGLRPLTASAQASIAAAEESEPTAILPAARLHDVVASLDAARAVAHPPGDGVNRTSSAPHPVAPKSTPVFSFAPLPSGAPAFPQPTAQWTSPPDSERVPAYTPFLVPSRKTKDQQLAKEIACGAAAFLVVLIPALYFLFR